MGLFLASAQRASFSSTITDVPGDPAESFKVYYSSSAGVTKSTLNPLGVTRLAFTTPFTVTGLVSKTVYYWRASRIVGGIEGELSDEKNGEAT